MGMRKYNQKIDFTRTAVHLRGNDGRGDMMAIPIYPPDQIIGVWGLVV